MPSYQDLANFLNHAGGGVTAAVASMLAFALATLFRGWWHTDREYQQLATDRDEWKEAALAATQTVHGQNEQISKLTAIVESLTTSLALQRAR
jgi:hypothetical protein